jgi:hypothetical protein
MLVTSLALLASTLASVLISGVPLLRYVIILRITHANGYEVT